MKHIKTFLLLTLLSFVGASCGEGERMRQRLAEVQACNQADTMFSARWIPTVDSLTDYFDNHGTPNERLLAHYLEGRIYHDMGEAPKAIDCYQRAVEQVDTAAEDCDFRTLMSVYGQMSQLFHDQFLPDDEITAIKSVEKIARKKHDVFMEAIAVGRLSGPYFLKSDTDSVLIVEKHARELYLKHGYKEYAGQTIQGSIAIALSRGKLSEAEQLLTIYRNESGLFDSNGELVQGGMYYIDKGILLTLTENFDSAQYYFHKAVKHGLYEGGYKGLLSVYEKRNIPDSIAKYARLFAAANDSSYLHVNQEIVHRISAINNYSRQQREAAQERAKAQETLILLGYIILIAIALFFIIIVISWQYRKTRKEKQRKINQLEESLSNAKQQRFSVQEELRKLKEKDYEGMIAEKEKQEAEFWNIFGVLLKEMIAEKEKQEAELTQTIEKLQAENERIKHKATDEGIDRLDDFLSSQIAQLFMKKANGKAERPIPSDAEWNLLMSEFCKYNPVTYKSFSEGKPLSPLEERICVLLILDIPEKTISIMTNSISTTVSNAKSRANRKLYGKKDAFLLKNNLIHTLRRS